MRTVLLPGLCLTILAMLAGMCYSQRSDSAWPEAASSQEGSETRAQIRRLEGLAQAGAVDGPAFWDAWRAFRLAHCGKPEYAEAAALLQQAPSPLDVLDRRNIPTEERLPWLPPEVVAVLGEHRGLDNGTSWNLSTSADGQLLASGGQVWATASMLGWAWLTAGTWEHYDTVVFSPKDRVLAAAMHAKGITLWDLSGKTPVRKADLDGRTFHAPAWSSDGKTLAALGYGNSDPRKLEVVVWDLSGERPRKRRTCSLRPGNGWATALSPDGRWLAVDHMRRGSTAVWDLNAPADREPINLADVQQPLFSPDSRNLLANDRSGQKVRLWKMTDSGPAEVKELPFRHYALLAFSRDGKLLAEVGEPESLPPPDGQWRIGMVQYSLLRVWDAAAAMRGELRAVGKPVQLPFSVYEAVFFPDGKRLAFKTQDGLVVLWDLERGRPSLDYRSHLGSNAARFAPDGRSLASGSNDGTVYWWDLTAKPPREREALRGRYGRINDLQFAPQGGYLACLGIDRREDQSVIRLWNLAGGRMKLVGVERPFSKGAFTGAYRIAFSANGRLFAALGTDDAPPRQQKEDKSKAAGLPELKAKLGVWNFREGSLTHRCTQDLANMASTNTLLGAFSADSRQFFCSLLEIFWVCPIADKDHPEKGFLTGKTGDLDHLAVSPDGRHLATVEQYNDQKANESGTLLRGWEVNGGTVREQWTCKHGPTIDALQFAPDGKTLASIDSHARRLTLWDAATGKKGREIALLWRTHGFDWAPDGRHVVVAGDGPIYIYRLAERGQPLAK
jgi:WD40 repeat protein